MSFSIEKTKQNRVDYQVDSIIIVEIGELWNCVDWMKRRKKNQCEMTVCVETSDKNLRWRYWHIGNRTELMQWDN